MCTYATVQLPVEGSAKGPEGSWRRISSATVYFDHPVHALADHTLNIDLTEPTAQSTRHIAIELTAESARQLADAIEQALASAGHLV